MQGSLSRILASIPWPLESQRRDGLTYFVRRIPGVTGHFFGRDGQGRPCLLIATSDVFPSAPLILASIEVRFSIPCRIEIPKGAEATDIFTAVLCTSQDPTLQGYFVHVCETVVRVVGREPTFQRVVECVQRFVDLFERLLRPSSRSVEGLFAELYFIYSSRSPSVAVEAWHSKIDERFDFSIGDIRLEVKATGTRQRVHNFSLEQCVPPLGTRGILVSFFVETSGGGVSLLELVERVEGQLEGDVDLVLKLQETIAKSFGSTAAAALSVRFDEELTKSSLRVYELEMIPAVRAAVPSEVSQVRFRSDITRAPTANVMAIGAQHWYARALLPRRV